MATIKLKEWLFMVKWITKEERKDNDFMRKEIYSKLSNAKIEKDWELYRVLYKKEYAW